MRTLSDTLLTEPPNAQARSGRTRWDLGAVCSFPPYLPPGSNLQ